jgi:hypothetical protein
MYSSLYGDGSVSIVTEGDYPPASQSATAKSSSHHNAPNQARRGTQAHNTNKNTNSSNGALNPFLTNETDSDDDSVVSESTLESTSSSLASSNLGKSKPFGNDRQRGNSISSSSQHSHKRGATMKNNIQSLHQFHKQEKILSLK